MEQATLITKYKNKILNTAIIILALVIIAAIHKNQAKGIDSLKAKRDIEIKKNEVLFSISQSEKKISAYQKLLGKEDPSLLINTVTGIAKDANVKIISVKPIGEENYPAYTRYSFNLIIGLDTYHTLGKFISKIENYSADVFFIDIASIRPVEEIKDAQDTYKLTAHLIISTIVFKN